MYPKFKLVKNLAKPFFLRRLQNTRISLQKYSPYRAAKIDKYDVE